MRNLGNRMKRTVGSLSPNEERQKDNELLTELWEKPFQTSDHHLIGSPLQTCLTAEEM